jgi:hypothetical protein
MIVIQDHDSIGRPRERGQQYVSAVDGNVVVGVHHLILVPDRKASGIAPASGTILGESVSRELCPKGCAPGGNGAENEQR